MNKEQAFWDLLGIKTNQHFKLNNGRRVTKDSFYFDFKMNLRESNTGKISNIFNLYDILSGREEIRLIKNITEKDKIAIKYAYNNFGAKWIAKDLDGKVYCYRKEPYKNEVTGNWYHPEHLFICGDFEFLNWRDEKPYEIDSSKFFVF